MTVEKNGKKTHFIQPSSEQNKQKKTTWLLRFPGLCIIEKQEIKCLNLTFIWDRREVSFCSPFVRRTLFLYCLGDSHNQQIFL